MAIIVLVIAVGIVAYFKFSSQTIMGQASVIDGDTIEIHGTRIRLLELMHRKAVRRAPQQREKSIDADSTQRSRLQTNSRPKLSSASRKLMIGMAGT